MDKTCKDCVHFIGGGDWNLCCTEHHEGYPFGFLCYEDTLACEKFMNENQALIERFPFLLPRNRWTGEVVPDYDYDYTELDMMPQGWRIAFGKQMCEEIREELVRANYLDKYRIVDIKEKWGILHWYDFGCTDKMMREIIPKYEHLSARTCIKCGKPATKISQSWISPWCDECAKSIQDRFVSVDEWFKEAKND